MQENRANGEVCLDISFNRGDDGDYAFFDNLLRERVLLEIKEETWRL
jgi:hypothetical protein